MRKVKNLEKNNVKRMKWIRKYLRKKTKEIKNNIEVKKRKKQWGLWAKTKAKKLSHLTIWLISELFMVK